MPSTATPYRPLMTRPCRCAVAFRRAAAATVSAAPRETVRVFTGAPMPAGMDTAFMQEDVRVHDDGRVVLPPGLKRGANVRPAGEDVQAGQVVLRQGHRMRPQDVALAPRWASRMSMCGGEFALLSCRLATRSSRRAHRAVLPSFSIPTASC